MSTAASPWSMVQYLAPTEARDWFWLGYAVTGAAALVYVAAYRHRKTTGVDTIALALLGSCIMPFFLPKMHERFFFLAEVLSFVLAFSGRDRRSVLIFWLVQGAWVLAMAGAIFNAPLVATGGGALILSAMLLLIDRLRPQPVRPELVVSGAS